jgi:DNA-directed RNA polymerase subunit RPC12/RpoP
MPDIKLKVIPEPAKGTRAIIRRDKAPLMRSEGPVNYVCGKCGTVLLESIQKGQVTGIVLRCPQCGSFNDTP